jgi:hypothetical protein
MYKMLTSGKFANPRLGSGANRVNSPTGLDSFKPWMERDTALTKLAMTAPLDFVVTLLGRIKRHAGSNHAISMLTPAQARQLRYYILRNKIKPADFRAAPRPGGHRDAEYNQLASLMRWPLVVPGQHDERQQPLPFALAGNDQSGNPREPVEQPIRQDRNQEEFEQMPRQRRRPSP